MPFLNWKNIGREKIFLSNKLYVKNFRYFYHYSTLTPQKCYQNQQINLLHLRELFSFF